MTNQNRLEIEQLLVLRDNYVYLVRDRATGTCAVVDPSVASPVLATLKRLDWNLDYILNTHHHHDHVGGNLELKAATGCRVVGYREDAHRIPGIDITLGDGETFALGSALARVIAVPGHTLGHIAYHFADDDVLFCGDTLFSLGCGRLFEGTPAQMWSSLGKLRALSDSTRVYCAHEYTESNARFALSIDPDNAALQARARQIRELRAHTLPTVPSILGEERAANPFLRADHEALQRLFGFKPGDAVATFAEIRHRKDVF